MMKFLLDLFPIIVFFVAYYSRSDIDQRLFFATGATIIAVLIQMLISWLYQRKVEKIHLLSFVLILILGAVTLILEDKRFFLWKPTAVYWMFALVFVLSEWFGQKTLTERMLGNAFHAPGTIWRRMNRLWSLFFLFLGVLNLLIAFSLPEHVWVNFKLFGVLGLSLAFALVQVLLLQRYLPKPQAPGEENG